MNNTSKYKYAVDWSDKEDDDTAKFETRDDAVTWIDAQRNQDRYAGNDFTCGEPYELNENDIYDAELVEDELNAHQDFNATNESAEYSKQFCSHRPINESSDDTDVSKDTIAIYNRYFKTILRN